MEDENYTKKQVILLGKLTKLCYDLEEKRSALHQATEQVKNYQEIVNGLTEETKRLSTDVLNILKEMKAL